MDRSTPHVLCAWAAEEAVRRRASLQVVYSWLPAYPVTAHDLFTDYGPMEHAAHALLAAALTRVREEVPEVSEVDEMLLLEHPATALVRAARGADLLVVGSRGRGGFAGLLLGSVSQRCVTHAPCPVAVVRAEESSVPPSRVVVGVDGSPRSYDALLWAAHAAVLRSARLDVVNVWAVPEILIPQTMAFSGDADALERASRSLLERMTDSLDDELDGKAPEVQLRSVAGTPANVLIEAAKDAYLLVVGARGLGGFRGLLLGSVSQQCSLHAPCPTVVVHQPAGEDKE